MRTCKMINKLIFYKHLSSCWGQKLLQTNKKLLQNLCCKCAAVLFYMGHNNDKISLQFRNLVILIKHEEMKSKMLSFCSMPSAWHKQKCIFVNLTWFRYTFGLARIYNCKYLISLQILEIIYISELIFLPSLKLVLICA